MVRGWKGDLYGSAHAMPRGTIWLYWLLAACPWSFVFLYAARNKLSRASLKTFWRQKKEWNTYLLLWALAPMLFFSLAGNILWTYVLTGLPAFAILMAGLFQYRRENIPASNDLQGLVNREFSVLTLGMSVLFTLTLLVVTLGQVSDKISQKNLITKYRALRSGDSEELIYLFQKPYSADFYSNGGAYLVKNLSEIYDLQREPERDFFVARNIECLPTPFLSQVDSLGKYGRYFLLRTKISEPSLQ